MIRFDIHVRDNLFNLFFLLHFILFCKIVTLLLVYLKYWASGGPKEKILFAQSPEIEDKKLSKITQLYQIRRLNKIFIY